MVYRILKLKNTQITILFVACFFFILFFFFRNKNLFKNLSSLKLC